MSAAASTSDPTPLLSPSGRLLNLVRKLIEYGNQLAATFRQRNTDTPTAEEAIDLGSQSIVLILGRITLALQRAGLLEAKIVREAPRLDSGVPGHLWPKRTRAPRLDTPPAEKPRPSLAQLPTVKQLAEKIRRQPIGAVFADICRDLGISPRHPLWGELQRAILHYGGNYARLCIERLDRVCPIAHIVERLKR